MKKDDDNRLDEISELSAEEHEENNNVADDFTDNVSSAANSNKIVLRAQISKLDISEISLDER